MANIGNYLLTTKQISKKLTEPKCSVYEISPCAALSRNDKGGSEWDLP